MRTVIFDMDGVLFPTEDLKFMAYARVFKQEYGVNLKDTKKRLGLPEKEAMELFLKLCGREKEKPAIPKLIREKRKEYYKILEQKNFKPITGVGRFLEELSKNGKFKLGLATSSNRRSADILLKRFGFKKYFNSILSLEHVAKPKPNPEIYLESARRLKVLPRNCAVFEDSLAGLAAAGRAGMRRVGITTGVSKNILASRADIVIDTFRDINIEKLDRLFV